MNECNGIIGMIFGHKFKSMIIERLPQPFEMEKSFGVNVEALVDKYTLKRYKIICKRCGKER